MIRQTTEGWWVIDGDSHHTLWIEQSGRLDHDRAVLPIILEYIPVGGTVVDIGAHIGTHTRAYCDKAGPSGHVFAIEPNPEASECCRRNCPEAKILEVGLADKLGTGLFIRATDNNHGTGYVDPLQPGNAQLITLDSLGFQRLDWIKIDIEGLECHALIGAEQTLKRCGHPPMLIEVNEGCLKRHGRSGKELLLLIHDLGYAARNVFKGQSMTGPQWDALCTRRSGV